MLEGDCITAGWGTHSLGSLIPGRSGVIILDMNSCIARHQRLKDIKATVKKDNIAKSRLQVIAKVRGPPHRPRRLHGQALYMSDSRMPASCGGYDVDSDDDDDVDDSDDVDSKDCPGDDARWLDAQGCFII